MKPAVSHTNSKLGPLIHSWSLPAGKQWACPGESQLCRSRCYAKSGYFRMQNVKSAHRQNLEFSQTDQFVDWMVATLAAQMTRVMRVHVSGDFLDVAYTRKWQEIVARSPQCQFFAYTRSWRDPAIFPELLHLAGQENFQLWWSIDRETGPAPAVRGVRVAYLAINDADAATAPDDCDLVFRDKSRSVMKKANSVQVCPPENGVKLSSPITCSRCGICWNRKDSRITQLLANYLPDASTTAELLAPEISKGSKNARHHPKTRRGPRRATG